MKSKILFPVVAMMLAPGVALAASSGMSGGMSGGKAMQPTKGMSTTSQMSEDDSGGQMSTGHRMTKALNLLEANGYGGFTNFKADGDGYKATVTRDGHDVTVHVDPDTGKVTNG